VVEFAFADELGREKELATGAPYVADRKRRDFLAEAQLHGCSAESDFLFKRAAELRRRRHGRDREGSGRFAWARNGIDESK
jgi:hypothetical protein